MKRWICVFFLLAALLPASFPGSAVSQRVRAAEMEEKEPQEELDPVKEVRPRLEGAKIAVTVHGSEDLGTALKDELERRLEEPRRRWPELGFALLGEPEVYGEYPLYTAKITLFCGKYEDSFSVGGRVVRHVWSRWLRPLEPGCTEPGEEMHYCVQCERKETRPVEPLGHDLELVPAAESCSQEGNVEYWRCRRCGACFSDKEGSAELTSAELTLPPLVTVEETAAGLTLSGLPDGVTACAAGYDGTGRLCMLVMLDARNRALLWPAGERPPGLRVFFLDGELRPVSAPWEG